MTTPTALEKKQLTIAGKTAIFQNKTIEVPFYHTEFDGEVFTPALSEDTGPTYLAREFKTRADDVFVMAYPKSGTHWLTYISDQISQQRQPKSNDAKNYTAIGTVPFLDRTPPNELVSLASPRYLYSHLPYHLAPNHSNSSLKYMVIARNPKDVAVSQFNFLSHMKMFDFNGTWDDFLTLFMSGKGFGGAYFDWVLAWWQHKDDDNVLFLTYEDLKKNLVKEVAHIAYFLEYPLSEVEQQNVATACTFDAMKKNKVGSIEKNKNQAMKKDKSFYRKGIVGDWKNYFSATQLEDFDQWCHSNLEGTGLEFDFGST
jgi:hypothetical protein